MDAGHTSKSMEKRIGQMSKKIPKPREKPMQKRSVKLDSIPF
jgi:hypothetical protein